MTSSPNAQPPNAITLGIRISTYGLGRDKNIQSICFPMPVLYALTLYTTGNAQGSGEHQQISFQEG